MAEFVTHTLAPVFDRSSRVLILGTMPSPKSREFGFYYGHPQNRFWKVLAAVLNEPVPETIEEKRSFVLRRHIALWDVLASCMIEGASDSSIKDPVPNDINLILQSADIRLIIAAGRKAESLYNQYCLPKTNQAIVGLPSTSPANCRNCGLAELTAAYRIILPYLETEEERK